MLLSVIIPTHNRARYAIPTIKSVLSISDEIQVVVSDTSLVDDISPFFSVGYSSDQLKIVRPPNSISVVDNFNIALNAADGDYLVFIGDDDFVSDEILCLAKWASNNSFDCLKFNFPAFYYWPDFHHKTRGDSYAGTLHITPFSGVVERHPTRKALSYALCNFGGGVFEMPRAYSGMISSKLIDKIIKKYGFLFGGVSPDIFSSALISIESKDCYLVDYPVIIPGASGASTTGQSANGGHRGDLRNNPHISPFKDLVWDTRVPDFYSVPTVWSFSLLKAVEILNENDPSLNLKPDFSRLFLKCMIYHPNEISRLVIPVKEVIRTEGKFKFFFSFFCAIFFEFAWGVKRILNRLIARRVKKNVIVLNGLISTEAAAEQLRNLVRAQKNKLKI